MNLNRITAPAPDTPTPPSSPTRSPTRAAQPGDVPDWPLPIAHTLVMPPAEASMSRASESESAEPGATMRFLIDQERDHGCRALILGAACLPVSACASVTTAFSIIRATAASSAGAAATGSVITPACAGLTMLSACCFAASLGSTGLALYATGTSLVATHRRRSASQPGTAGPPPHADPTPADPAQAIADRHIVIQQPDGSVELGAFASR